MCGYCPHPRAPGALALSLDRERDLEKSERRSLRRAQPSETRQSNKMNWQALVAIATLVAVNIAAIQWLFNRHDSVRAENATRLEHIGARAVEIEKDLLRLRAELPIDYVRREDWIRFSNTLEAKLDAMRAEMRSELGELKGKIAR